MTPPVAPYVLAAARYRRAQVKSDQLRAEYVAALAAARADGASVASIAATLGVDRSRVYQLLNGKD